MSSCSCKSDCLMQHNTFTISIHQAYSFLTIKNPIHPYMSKQSPACLPLSKHSGLSSDWMIWQCSLMPTVWFSTLFAQPGRLRCNSDTISFWVSTESFGECRVGERGCCVNHTPVSHFQIESRSLDATWTTGHCAGQPEKTWYNHSIKHGFFFVKGLWICGITSALVMQVCGMEGGWYPESSQGWPNTYCRTAWHQCGRVRFMHMYMYDFSDRTAPCTLEGEVTCCGFVPEKHGTVQIYWHVWCSTVFGYL